MPMPYNLPAVASLKLRNRDGGYDVDVERQGPPKSRIATSAESRVHVADPGSASVSTAITWSTTPLRWLKTWKSAPSERGSIPEIELKPILEARNQFICTVTNNTRIEDQTVLDACDWYAHHVERKIRRSWATHMRPVLRGVNHESRVAPSISDIAQFVLKRHDYKGTELKLKTQARTELVAFKFMTAVVTELSKQNNHMALTELCDSIYSQGLLDDTDEHRRDALQLLYAAVGWLSILYTPRINNFDPECLSIEDPLHSPKPTQTFSYHHQHQRQEVITQLLLADCHDYPLVNLLDRFGKTFPHLLSTVPQTSGDTWIDEHVLGFHILTKVAHIKIEWVEDLSQHLEFDVCSKKLKIFKYPSICIVALTNPKATTWLGTNTQIDTVMFYHEMLLTYRLIFESDPRASAQFHCLMSSLPESRHEKLPATVSPHGKTEPDPLLTILCGSYHEAPIPSSLYDALEVAPLSSNNNYNALNFPFLGTRLLELQNNVMSRNSNSLKALWHDRRVVANWYTLWAVIIIGGGSLVLGMIVIALQIVGLIFSKQQVDASRKGL